MKRISFKDSGGLNLTQAVLTGRKTMTRIEVPEWVERNAMVYAISQGKDTRVRDYFRLKFAHILGHSPYNVGDVVTVQQAYKDTFKEFFGEVDFTKNKLRGTAGWTNKMFVRASLMPHHIRITDVRVEMLQDISDEDCLREGIIKDDEPYSRYFFSLDSWYNTPRAAFAALIDKVSGRGTWNSNLLVWVYSFELVD